MDRTKQTQTILQSIVMMACKQSIKTALFFALTLTGCVAIYAQDNIIKTTIQGKVYGFTAQSYSSSTETMRQLTTDYSLLVRADSVIASLPYFGQSYSAQLKSEGGIDFVSANFDYTAAEKKKGRWEILIRPKDIRGVKMYLTVYPNGTALLQVTSPNRESMSYNGYVSAR